MSNQIYRMNEAEGIFFPAFDKHICDDSQMSMEGGQIERIWDSLTFRGGSHFTVHWHGETTLGAYDFFQCFLSIPKEAEVSVTGVVDGEERRLAEKIHGEENPIEIKGKLPAHGEESVLTDMYFELDSATPANVMILSWLGLLQSDREAQAEEKVPVWQDAWESEITKGHAGTLRSNMVLDEADGERMKALVAQDEKLKNSFREKAEAGMEIDPKSVMREYAPTSDYRFVRVKDRGRAVLEGPILNLSIAGWLLEEPRYSAQAARLILALIAMKWCEGPICDLEGSRFHHV